LRLQKKGGKITLFFANHSGGELPLGKAGRSWRASMSLILSILGLVVFAAGVVTIAFGIPINEFNLGNTLIVAGTTAAAAGLILIGLAAVVDQLNQIAKALRPRAAARAVLQPQAAEPAVPAPVRPVPVQAPAQPPLHAPAPVYAPVQAPVPAQVRPPMPAPPRPPVFAQSSVEERVGEAPEHAAPEAAFSAIERLRLSLARADRKSGEVEDAESVPYAAAKPAPATAAGPGPDANRDANRGANPGVNGGAPAAGAGAVEATRKPALDFLFRSKARVPQPEAFDAVWPKRGQRRPDEASQADQSARPTPAEAPIDRPAPAQPYDDVRPSAILKSGVVDGMAYTLYADGSIEAQLPQGTVRFGSIAELRSHIENNS
jgi:hypothetical protein